MALIFQTNTDEFREWMLEERNNDPEFKKFLDAFTSFAVKVSQKNLNDPDFWKRNRWTPDQVDNVI